MNVEVLEKFNSLSEDVKTVCLRIREMVYSVATNDKRIGPLSETLKWGEPSYLTDATKAGTTLRIWKTKDGLFPAIYVNCQTSLIQTFRDIYPDSFDYQGNRAVVITKDITKIAKPLEHCIAMTLTYHLSE